MRLFRGECGAKINPGNVEILYQTCECFHIPENVKIFPMFDTPFETIFLEILGSWE